MIELIRTKIRALVEDFQKNDFEIFEYTISNIFPIAQTNITITSVLKNGVALGSGEYSFDSTTNKIEITTSLTSLDKIEVDYTYYKYSDDELDKRILGALSYMSLFSACSDTDYELEDETIVPTPDNKTTDLIAVIASILINPDYAMYKLPNLTVQYSGRIPKQDRIEKLIMKFNMGLGSNDIIILD